MNNKVGLQIADNAKKHDLPKSALDDLRMACPAGLARAVDCRDERGNDGW